MRTLDEAVREKVLGGIERITRAEAAASGSPAPPEVVYAERFPLTVNEPAATARTFAAFTAALGEGCVIDPGPGGGQRGCQRADDRGGCAAGVLVPGRLRPGAVLRLPGDRPAPEDVPSNHSPHFGPIIEPTLSSSVAALEAAAREWLGSR